MSNATRNHSVANFVLAAIILTIPVISRAQGLFAQAANSATKVRDAYAEIYNGFYGVGHRKTLYRAALDKRPDGTPNISVDAEAHTAAVTIRLSVNDAAYNAWKADARQRLDGLVRSIPNVDYNYETDHQPGDVRIGDRHYFFNNNELSVIQKWERDNAPKKAEIVVRVLFLDKDGNERWRYDIPLGRFFLSVGGAMDGTPWEPLDWLIRKKDYGFKEDSIAVIRFSKMSDSFMESISDVKCVVIDDETLIPERLATRKEIVPQIIQGMVLIPDQTFRLGKYEVTQAQWEAIMGTNPVGEKDESTGGNRPVFYVSWNDCQDFLKVLNSLPEIQDSGLVFRLPSRQEWELSARDYQSGWDVDHRGPEPVGTGFPPNKCGLYDIHGNVAEWTSTSSGGKRIACGESVGSTASWQELAPDKSMSFVGVRLCADDSKVESERKVQAEMRAREEAERKAREATELAKRLDEMGKTIVPALLDSMVVLPGKDFRVGRCEVTQKQWEAIMGNNPSQHKGDDNPVEMVSWNDCQQFLMKLNALPAAKESGLVFRLPTEEEWEYACRAGATGHYCRLDGTEVTAGALEQVAWFVDNSLGQTHPVGQKKPNAFGLYDMHGNVSEWTSTADGLLRVCRGGCFWDLASGCDFSVRHSIPPSDQYCDHGFRLCAEAVAK